MPIDVRCPRCDAAYSLDPGLLGKKMRCPNTLCRAVFEVRKQGGEEAKPLPKPPAASPETPPTSRTGRVGEVVPVLPAEAAASVDAPSPPVPPASRAEPVSTVPSPTAVAGPEATAPPTPVVPPEPPPIRRPAVAGPAAERPPLEFPEELAEEDAAEESPELPGENIRSVRFGDLGRNPDSAPPVRRPGPVEVDSATTEGFPTAPADAPPTAEEHAPRQSARKRSLLVILVMLATLAGLGAGGWYLVRGKQAEGEAELHARALEHYRQREFSQAVARLQELNRAFPESPKRAEYLFLAELADVRRATEEGRHESASLLEAFERLGRFIDRYRNDPLLNDQHEELWRTLRHLADDLILLAEKTQEPRLLDRASHAWAAAGKFRSPREVDETAVDRKMRQELTRVAGDLVLVGRHREAFAQLVALQARPSAAAVRQAQALLEKIAPDKKAEGRAVLETIKEGHRASIRFTPTPEGVVVPPPPRDEARFLFPAPDWQRPPPGSPPTGGAVVPALARGLLFALDPDDGRVRWVHRLGADAAVPPMRVEASPLLPALFLALETDEPALVALAGDSGRVLWRHPLAEASVAPPLVLGTQALIATLSGRIDQVDLLTGRLLGFYHTGQMLRLGGVLHPETGAAFFPAEEQCVVVLDTRRRVCSRILYTDHPSGEIPCLPILLEDPDASPGSDAGGERPPSRHGKGWMVLLRTRQDATHFEIHPLPLEAGTAETVTIPPFPSRLSDPPWFDGARMHLVGADGSIRFLGVRQKGNRDSLLFPLAEKTAPGSRDRDGRALVVFADLDDVWTWADGVLQRWDCSLQAEGATPRWPVPPALGWPAQAPLAWVGPEGRPLMVLTCQDPNQALCRVRLVDGSKGVPWWQRRLGLVAQGPVHALDSSVVVVEAGGLHRFDPDRKDPVLLSPLADTGAFLIVPGKNRLDLVERRKGGNQVTWKSWTGRKEAPERTADLPSGGLIDGAALEDGLVLALQDGFLARLAEKGGPSTLGPQWCSNPSQGRTGMVVPLRGNDFLTGDGDRHLVRWSWPAAGNWRKEAETTLSRRIIGRPAVLDLGTDRAVVVAEEGGDLTLLDAERLETRRRWRLPGLLTGGPFVLGDRIAVVLDRERLLWIDPLREAPLWEHTALADIVGRPVLVEGMLVVADLSGRVTVLDPSSGRQLGPGYQFRARVVPTAAPAPFSPDTLFVPLSDGSVALVPLRAMRPAKNKKGRGE